MTEEKRFLDKAYGIDRPELTQALYADWSESYDAEVRDNGYVTPERCAKALAHCASALDAPLLDVGCGTGLSGAAFRQAGFTCIDGCDFSPQMLDQAKAKNVYRSLMHTSAEEPFPFKAGAYTHMAAVGVLLPGHAPATMITDILRLLPKNGLFVFSLNDHALEDESYQWTINSHYDCGTAAVEFKEHGTHLPKAGMRSMVYVLRKM